MAKEQAINERARLALNALALEAVSAVRSIYAGRADAVRLMKSLGVIEAQAAEARKELGAE